MKINTAYDVLEWLRHQAIADASFEPPLTGEARLGHIRVQCYPASGTFGWFGVNGKTSRGHLAIRLAEGLGIEKGMG